MTSAASATTDSQCPFKRTAVTGTAVSSSDGQIVRSCSSLSQHFLFRLLTPPHCHLAWLGTVSGKCILTVWEHSSVLAPCKCPICRRAITLLAVSRAAGWGQSEPEAARVLQDLAKYNRVFGGGPVSVWQVRVEVLSSFFLLDGGWAAFSITMLPLLPHQ